MFDWRSDAFFYRAFKIAVARLLDALEPPGAITAHKIVAANRDELDSLTKKYVDSFKTPDTRAGDAVDFILAALRAAPSRVTEEDFREFEAAHPSFAYPLYGIADAARDLTVKPQSGGTVSVTFPLQLALTGEPTLVTVSDVPQSYEGLKKEPKR
jgi:hypothetical protein